jgi:hypothetical protein
MKKNEKKKSFEYKKYDVFESGWGRYRRKLAIKPVFFIISKIIELGYNLWLWFRQFTFKHSLIIYIFIILFVFCFLVLITDFYLWLWPVFYLIRSFFKYFILLWLYLFSQYDVLHLTWFLFTFYIIYRMVKWVFKKN